MSATQLRGGKYFTKIVGHYFQAIDLVNYSTLHFEYLHDITRYVEVLDKYFGSVCELDIIFNFEKAYFILDELILGGELQVIQILKCHKQFTTVPFNVF